MCEDGSDGKSILQAQHVLSSYLRARRPHERPTASDGHPRSVSGLVGDEACRHAISRVVVSCYVTLDDEVVIVGCASPKGDDASAGRDAAAAAVVRLGSDLMAK